MSGYVSGTMSSMSLAIWAFTVALSRCIMGRHYFSDVFGGFLLGFITIFLISKVRSLNVTAFYCELQWVNYPVRPSSAAGLMSSGGLYCERRTHKLFAKIDGGCIALEIQTLKRSSSLSA
jgi:membrane-associated phospholipid phosphatase